MEVDQKENNLKLNQELIKTSQQLRENFSEVKDFGHNLNSGKIAVGGNPPYSIIIEGIHFEEDAEEIIEILFDHSLISENELNTYKKTISSGRLLIPQISEYAAYYIANKLRHLNCVIKTGQAGEIFSSNQYNDESRGLLSTRNIFQDKIVQGVNRSKRNVILSKDDSIEGMAIKYHLNLVFANKIYSSNLLQYKQNNEIKGHQLTEEEMDQIYEELQVSIKNKATDINANAVLGINYDIKILSQHDTKIVYKVTCIGNAVWLEQEPTSENYIE